MNFRVDLLIVRVRDYFFPAPTDRVLAWAEWANRLPPSAFLVWLAGNVATELCDCKPRRVTPAQLVDSIETDSAGMLQDDAERFLRRTYFLYTPFCFQCQRMVRVFRHLVQLRIRRRYRKELLR